MLHNSYIAVPFALGLTLIGVATAHKVADYKKQAIKGQNSLVVCDLNMDNCTNFRNKEKIPINRVPPLGFKTAVNASEINCLARNITQEAVKNYIVDKIHIAWATINRVKSEQGKTICEVISQPNQMSWYSNHIKRAMPPLQEDVILAKNVLAGYIKNPSPDCMITNWYNIEKDSKNSFNAKKLHQVDICSKHPKNTPHYYMEVRNDGK